MSKWTIYNKEGQVKLLADSLEYHDTWMGEEFVTVNITSATPIELKIGDYLTYRGSVYTIYSLPTALKQARSESYGEAFKCEGVKLSARSTELSDIRFFDIVLNDNNLHYTSLPNFSFYAETVDDLLDRILANTERSGETPWFIISPNYNRTMQRYPLPKPEDPDYDAKIARRNEADTLWRATFGDPVSPTGVDVSNEKTKVEISIDDQNVFDSLQHIKNTFGLNFVTRDRNLIVGGEGISTENIFKYGKGNGLYQIERTADADQQVVTKLFAYGSDKNLPLRYYAELGKTCILKSTITVTTSVSPTIAMHFIPDITDYEYYTKRSKSSPGPDEDPRYVLKLTCGGITVTGFFELFETTTLKEYRVQVWYGTRDFEEPNRDNAIAFLNAINGKNNVIVSDGISLQKWPKDHTDYSTVLMPNNMAVNMLMLPGFPRYALSELCKTEISNGITKVYIRKSPSDTWPTDAFVSLEGEHDLRFSNERLRPYIVSGNADEIGIKEGNIQFNEENDDNGLQEVYPSVEGMTENDVFNNGSTKRLDEIVACEIITDNGKYRTDDTDYKFPNFHITLPDLGFDLKQTTEDSGGELTISMKDGYCGGRDFKVHNITKKEEGGFITWDLEVERCADDTLSLMFPYSDRASRGEEAIANEPYQIQTGDHYVLTGINITETSYIWSASVEALRKSIRWLLNNDYTRFTYLPKVDEKYMKRQDDAIKSGHPAASWGTVSLHDTLKAGMLMAFQDSDLNVEGSVFIDQLTIKEDGDNGIPTYDVVLRNDKQVGTLQRVQNQINSLSSYVAGGGGGDGMNTSQIRSLIKTYGGENFLSKVSDDIAQGVITLAGGLVSKVKAVFEDGFSLGTSEKYGADGEGNATLKSVGGAADDALSIRGGANVESDLNVGGNVEITGQERVDRIQSHNYSGSGLADTGYLITNDNGSGSSLGVFDYLTIRKKMIVNSLEIKETHFTAGDVAQTLASAEIARTDYFYVDENGKRELLGYSSVLVPWSLKNRLLALAKGDLRGIFGHYKQVRMTLTENELLRCNRIRCYFLSKDGERSVENWFRPGDLARCQTWNVLKTQRETFIPNLAEHAGNVYWWREIHDVSWNTGVTRYVAKDNEGQPTDQTTTDEQQAYENENHVKRLYDNGIYHTEDTEGYDDHQPVTIEGNTYHWFDVEFDYLAERAGSTASADAHSDIPAAGDKVVQFGNVVDPDRMNIVLTEVNGSSNPDAPAIKMLRGVYTFDLNECWWGGVTEKIKISPSTGIRLFAPMFEWGTETGNAKQINPRPEHYWTEIALERDDFTIKHIQDGDTLTFYPNYSDDIVDNEGRFQSRGGFVIENGRKRYGSILTPIPKNYVRKCRYYDQVSHNGSMWLTSFEEHWYWIDRQGNAVDGQTAGGTHVRSYTTQEPTPAANDWTLQVQTGAFKSSVFCRSNSIPATPSNEKVGNYNTYDNPIPPEVSGQPTWSDSIQEGNAMVWMSTAWFDVNGIQGEWTPPRQQTDTETLDVEFSPNATQPSAPYGTAANKDTAAIKTKRHNQGGTGKGWYDPNDTLPSGVTWSDMKWRAERKIKNGVYYGSWAITRIKGENSVRIDLDNENDSMLYTSGGKLVSGDVLSTARLFDGAKDVSASADWTMTAVDCTMPSGNSRNIVVTGMTAATGYVNVQAVYTDKNGTVYTKTARLTLKKLVDVDKYDLDITPNSIAYNATKDQPATSTLTIKVWKMTVDGNRVLSNPPSGYGVYVNNSKQTESSTGTYSYTTDNSAISSVQVKIAKDADLDAILDSETIPVNKAEDGAPGTSPYFADIDNEMDSVACDKNGKTLTVYDTTIGVSLWHGSHPLDITTLTTDSIQGFTITPNKNARTIRIQVAKDTSIAEVNKIGITIAGNGSGTLPLHFVLNGVRQGENGEPAVLYSLVPSASSVVKKKDGTYSVDNVSCTRQKNVGGTITNNTTDGAITYKLDGGTEKAYTNNTDIAVTSFTKSIQFIFKVDGKVVDIETIPMVADGVDGVTPTVEIVGGYWVINGQPTGVKAEGTDGTGVEIKGTVATPSKLTIDVEARKGYAVPMNNDGTDGQKVEAKQGDCYICDSDRHLYMFTKTPSLAWNDLGEFKGDSGESSYMHIAYADYVGLSNGQVTSVTGFTVVNGGKEYDWWGFCTNNEEQDPGAGASTDAEKLAAAKKYKWNYMKGKDGNGYERIYLFCKDGFTPKINETGTDGAGRTKADDEYLPAVGNYNSTKCKTSRWTDDPEGEVSATWPVLWWSERKRIINDATGKGSWGSFCTPTEHNRLTVSIKSVSRTFAISSVGTTASETTEPTHDGNWTTNSPAVTEQFPYLWAKEIVTFTDNSSTTKYYCIGTRGDNGVDAKDFEWVYIRTQNNVAPTINTDDGDAQNPYRDSNGKTYVSDDHLPHVVGGAKIENNHNTYECTDDPKGVTEEYPFEWEIKRTKGDVLSDNSRAWNPYSGTMKLHNNYASSNVLLDIDNDNDEFGADSESEVIDEQSRSTTVSMYYGKDPQTLRALSAVLKYSDDDTAVPPSVAEVTSTLATGVVQVTIHRGVFEKSGLYALITASCDMAENMQIRFTITKLLGGTKGETPIIYQLDLTQKTLSYGRDASNNLVAISNSVTVRVKRTEGNDSQIKTLAESGKTCTWGFDGTYDTYTVDPENPTITVAANNVGNHTEVSIALSTGDKENVTIVKDGANGASGDTIRTVSIYQWSKTTPTKPTYTSIPPSGWSTTDSGTHAADALLWMCWGEAINGNLTSDGWNGPVRMSGKDGDAGADGETYEYIYKQTNTLNGYGQHPKDIDTPDPHSTGQSKADDDFVPDGWTDNPQGVSSNMKYEYCAIREKTKTGWSAFQNPFPWSVYGDKGQDGDGYEYVFFRTKGESYKPTVSTSGDSAASVAASEYRPRQTQTGTNYNNVENPSRWTDNPTGVTSEWPVEWVSQRRKLNETWQAFDTPSVWSNYSYSPWIADLDNEMDSVACGLDGKPIAQQEVSTNVSLFYGSTKKKFKTSVSGATTGMSVSYNNSATAATSDTVKVTFTTDAVLTDSVEFTITLTADDDNTIQRALKLTVIPLNEGARYNLVPSNSSISKSKTGVYSPATLTCTYNKYDVAKGQYVTPSGCTITYTKDGNNTAYSYKTLTPGTDFTDNVTFILTKDSIVIDRETVNVVKDGNDGLSQQSYMQTQEAWSNDASSANAASAPATDASAAAGQPGSAGYPKDSDWTDNTPANTKGYAYLWRRSRLMTLKSDKSGYNAGNWTYTRLSGTNGTSINIKDIVASVVVKNGTFPTTGMANGDLGIKQEDKRIWKFNGTSWAVTSTTASDGDSYSVSKNCTIDLDGDGISENIKGHLVMWSEEASKWIDIGQFQGQDAVQYYTHIAWGKGITLGTPTYTPTTNQTTTPNASACEGFHISPLDDYDWMGTLIDSVSDDCTNWQNYTWKYTKGDDGVRGSFKSRVFTRSAADISSKVPQGGTYESPLPNPLTQDGVTWSDGIPTGTDSIWSSVCTFYGNGNNSGWSAPTRESDTDDLDIEFSPKLEKPDEPSGTAANKDTAATKTQRHNQGWYDPNDTLPTGTTWSDMKWRAERKIKNKVYEGSWVISQIKGEKGNPSGNTATIYLYKRSASVISASGISTTLYYKFSTKKLYTTSACTTEATTQLNGWSLDIPTGTAQIYITAAVAYSNTAMNSNMDVDDIGSNEWVTPVEFNGADGINSATVFLYKRSASEPTGENACPSQTLYYKFADGELYTLSGSTYTKVNEGDTVLKGWKLKLPSSDGNPCYVIQAAALSAGAYDAIVKTTTENDWSSVRKLVEDGKNSVRIDLDNQADLVSVDADNKVRFARTIVVRASIYDGATKITDDSLISHSMTESSMKIGNRNASSVTKTNGVVTVQWDFVAGDAVTPTPKTFTLTYGDKDYSAEFTLNTTPSEILYQVSPRPSEISFSKGSDGTSLTPSYVDLYCGYTKSNGSGTERVDSPSASKIDDNNYLYYRIKGSNGSWGGWNAYTSYIRVNNSTTDTDIELCISSASNASNIASNGSNIIDCECVPIVKDGVNGGKGQSSFKSTVFTRTNETPIEPDSNYGSFASPNPPETGSDRWVVKKSGGSVISNTYWHDGIPSGDAKLWASTRIFTSDGQSPQQSTWTTPSQMTDTETYDVEFAKKQTDDATPVAPNGHNQHGGDQAQVWYDPTLDSTQDFTNMYWRAERECKNGVWGSWVIVRIKGEQGDPGGKATKVTNYFLALDGDTQPAVPSITGYDSNGRPQSVISGKTRTWYAGAADPAWSKDNKYLYEIDYYQLSDGGVYWSNAYFKDEWAAQGDDGYTISVNPVGVTITQNSSGNFDVSSSVPAYVDVKITKGNDTATNLVTALAIASNQCTADPNTPIVVAPQIPNSDLRLKVTGVNTDAANAKYTQGSVVLAATADGKTFSITVPVAVNYLGIYIQDIFTDRREEMAYATKTLIDNEGRYTVDQQSYGSVTNAAGQSKQWIETVNTPAGTVAKYNTRISTAESNINRLEREYAVLQLTDVNDSFTRTVHFEKGNYILYVNGAADSPSSVYVARIGSSIEYEWTDGEDLEESFTISTAGNYTVVFTNDIETGGVTCKEFYIKEAAVTSSEFIQTADSITAQVSSKVSQSSFDIFSDSIQATVKNITPTKNLLKGVLSGNNFGSASSKNFTNNPSLKSTTLDTAGYITVASGSSYIYQSGITIERGKYYTMSFELKSNQTTVGFCVFNYSGDGTVFSGEGCDTNCLPKTSGKKKTAKFKVSGTGTATIAISLKCSAIRYPQLEEGEAATDFVTNDKEISSGITQTASEINLEVKNDYETAGLKIVSSGLQLRGGHVDFTGSNGTPYIKVSVDSDGMPHFIFMARDGVTEMYDLGYTGLRQLVNNAVPDEYVGGNSLQGYLSGGRVVPGDEADTINPASILGQEPSLADHMGEIMVWKFNEGFTVANHQKIYNWSGSSVPSAFDGAYLLDNTPTAQRPGTLPVNGYYFTKHTYEGNGEYSLRLIYVQKGQIAKDIPLRIWWRNKDTQASLRYWNDGYWSRNKAHLGFRVWEVGKEETSGYFGYSKLSGDVEAGCQMLIPNI